MVNTGKEEAFKKKAMASVKENFPEVEFFSFSGFFYSFASGKGFLQDFKNYDMIKKVYYGRKQRISVGNGKICS